MDLTRRNKWRRYKMKVGIIVHSFTGHTYSVGEVIKRNLDEANHTVELHKLDIVGGEVRDEIDINKIQFSNNIDINQYDVLVFGGPVRGFSISPSLKAFLTRVQDIKDKPVYIYVTHYFPFSWMGGTSAIKQIKVICEEKESKIIGTGIVDWKNGRREEQITNLAQRIKKDIEAI